MKSWPAVIVGLVLGTSASAADAFQGFGPGALAWVRVLSIALNMGIAWVGTAFLMGRTARNRPSAVIAGLATLYFAVFGYYLFGALFGDRLQVTWTSLTATSVRWLVAATVAGPLFGLLGYLAHRSGWPGIIAALSLPTTAALEVFGQFRISLAGFKVDPLREWTVTAVLVSAAAAATWSLVVARTANQRGADVRTSAHGPHVRPGAF